MIYSLLPCPNIVFRTDDLDSMKQMIAREDYVAFFPKFMAAGDFYLEQQLIRQIPVEDRDMTLKLDIWKAENTDYRHWIKQLWMH